MGCDIHLYTEQHNTFNQVTGWYNVDFYARDYYDNKLLLEPIFRDRDYDLFAALADVRNYGHITPMSPAKGIPADVHTTTKKEVRRWGSDGHSHSCCTLQELYDYQKANGQKTQSGLITKEQADELDIHGTLPDSWCQGSSDKTMVKRTWTVGQSPVDHLIEALEPRFKNLCYLTYCDGPIPKEQAEKFRIVFFFDN